MVERLFFERLEYKSEKILELYQNNNNDWEATLFKLLIENFGIKINQASFLSIGESLPFEVFRRLLMIWKVWRPFYLVKQNY